MGITIPSSVKEAIHHPKQFEAFVSWMEQMGYGEQFSKLTIDSLKQMYKAVEVRLPQIDTELSNLQVKIKVQKAIIDKLNEQMKGLDEQQSKLIAGGYSAGYYSYKWAEVLDADAFSLFKQKGIFNQDVAESFRNNILSKGGTEHPMVLYKRFRGQEPTIDALLIRNGIKN